MDTEHFLLGFAATFISGTVPFMQKYFDLTGGSGNVKLGWSAFLGCFLAILATQAFVVFVLLHHQQTVVIQSALPDPRDDDHRQDQRNEIHH